MSTFGMTFSVRGDQIQYDDLSEHHHLSLAGSRMTLYFFFSELSMNLDCLYAQTDSCAELQLT